MATTMVVAMMMATMKINITTMVTMITMVLLKTKMESMTMRTKVQRWQRR